MNYIRTTTTQTGLQVTATRITKQYAKGTRISAEQMVALALFPAQELPKWNYEVRPQPAGAEPTQPAATPLLPPTG